MRSFLSNLTPLQKNIIIAAAVLVFFAVWIPSRYRTVTIRYNGEETTLRTASLSLQEMLDTAEITLGEDDCVTTTGFDTYGFFGDFGMNTSYVDIRSAISVEIEADGLLYHVSALTGDTVSDVLDVSGLEVRENDVLSEDAGAVIEDGDRIKITRIDYITTTEEEVIERGVSYRGTSLLKNGRTSVISYGQNGTMLKTFQQKVIDGVTQESELISEEVIKNSVNDVYLLGDGSPCSPLDYGYNIVNNVPTSYKTVYRNQRASAYYAKAGTGTASGRRAQMGYIAVDPSVIPYGTKLWIVGTGGGSFVYGYALAADTGSAMRSGRNFVDLFYDTYYECVLHGIKYVDVYVLE